jgi:hypothetical protein
VNIRNGLGDIMTPSERKRKRSLKSTESTKRTLPRLKRYRDNLQGKRKELREGWREYRKDRRLNRKGKGLETLDSKR